MIMIKFKIAMWNEVIHDGEEIVNLWGFIRCFNKFYQITIKPFINLLNNINIKKNLRMNKYFRNKLFSKLNFKMH